MASVSGKRKRCSLLVEEQNDKSHMVKYTNRPAGLLSGEQWNLSKG